MCWYEQMNKDTHTLTCLEVDQSLCERVITKVMCRLFLSDGGSDVGGMAAAGGCVAYSQVSGTPPQSDAATPLFVPGPFVWLMCPASC